MNNLEKTDKIEKPEIKLGKKQIPLKPNFFTSDFLKLRIKNSLQSIVKSYSRQSDFFSIRFLPKQKVLIYFHWFEKF